jgi:hypothetical protein
MHRFEKAIVWAHRLFYFLFNITLLLIFFFSFTEGSVLFFDRATAVLAHTHGDTHSFLSEMILVFFAFFGLIALCTVWVSKDLRPDAAKLFSIPLGILREKILLVVGKGKGWFQ